MTVCKMHRRPTKTGGKQQGGMEDEPRTHDDDIPDNGVENGER